MGMFGKIGSALGQIGKYYTSPEGAQSGLAILQDYGTGGSDNYRALQMQRQKLAQEQQQQQAMAALMGRMRPQDTRTPVINNMIDMNNQRMGAFQNGMQHQESRMDVGKAGLDFSDPETIKALTGLMSAGGNPQLPLALSQMMQPEKPPEPRYIEGPNGIYAAGPDGVSMAHAYPDDPLKQEALRALIEQRRASAGYSNVKAANPYAPQRARAGGGGGGGGKKPWEMF